MVAFPPFDAGSNLLLTMTTRSFSLTLALGALMALGHSPPHSAQVLSQQKIGATSGGFAGTLDDNDFFGSACANIGDLNGDGTTDLAVGALLDDDGGIDRGAVWILFMNPNGTVAAQQKISQLQGGFAGVLHDGDQFGGRITSLGDLDGDGFADLAVGARADDDGGFNRGAVWILFLNFDGTVRAHQKISSTQGSFLGQIDDRDEFGVSLEMVGDLDGDSVVDLAVGAFVDDDGGPDRGAVWILFLQRNGQVKGFQKISSTQGGFTGVIDNNDQFGISLAALGDLDLDGKPDLAVGVRNDDDGAVNAGAVWILGLNPNGTVANQKKISATQGSFAGPLDANDEFGWSVASLGDIDRDGSPDLAVGARQDDDGSTDQGAVWILLLRPNGQVKAHLKISALRGGLMTDLDSQDSFGGSVESLGDLDGDGSTDVAIGAFGDDDAGTDRGAVYIVFLCTPTAARATFRNGSGMNPPGYSEITGAVLGTTWQTAVDIATPGALASIVAWGYGGPTSGLQVNGLVRGELLCRPPFLLQTGFGQHAAPIPVDCSILGVPLSTQAATVSAGEFKLQNALDIQFGSY